VAPRSGGATRTITANKELILAGGAFGSPQILLNSGIGPKDDLEAVGVKQILDLPDVGKGMTDHMTIRVSFQLYPNVTSPVVDPVAALEEWKTARSGPLSEAVGHLIYWERISEDAEIWETHSDPSTGPNSPHIEVSLSQAGTQASSFIVLLTPKSKGSIKLRSNNPFDDPLIDLGYLTDDDGFDFEAFKEGVRIAKKLYSGAGWSGYVSSYLGPDPDVLSDAEFKKAIVDIVGTFWHPVGTAAMSRADAKEGVVDPDLRVKGVKGLRIVDASVIPYVPTAHTQTPVYVLAERISDVIKEDYIS